MTEKVDNLPPACERARAAIQDRLDGPVDATRQESLERHLEGCEACRLYGSGLVALQAGLRELPPLELPEDALEEVWDRTVRAGSGARRRAWQWQVAAAAVLVAMIGAVWWSGRDRQQVAQGPDPDGALVAEQFTDDEIAEAREQARLILGLTASAIRRSERAAVQSVLGEIAPALERIPVRWPIADRDTGRTGT